jgi:nitrous oxidase accessory protein NosD
MVLYVNGSGGHDTGACSAPSSACAHISYALTQAGAGGTIKVSAGTYAEQLVITQSVTIIGRSNVTIAPATVSQNDIGTDSPTPELPIVDVHNATQAVTNVNLENLTIDGAAAGLSSFNSCSNNFPGVYFHDASGSLVGDRVVNMEMAPSLFGCQTGKGVGILVAADIGDASNVLMQQVAVNHYQKNGIECIDTGTTCGIQSSVVTGIGPTSLTSQNGVEIWGTASVTVLHNKISKNTYTGTNGPASAVGLLVLNAGTVNIRHNMAMSNDVDMIALGNYPAGPMAPAGTWSFIGNKFFNATDDAPPPFNVPGHGYGDGLDVDSTTNPVIIRGNRTSANFEYGIGLFGTSGATVRHNHGHGDYDGIYIGGPGSAFSASTGNTVTGNRAQYDRNDGILADVTAAESGNTFSSNALHHSTNLEAQDLSTGIGTHGTANGWSGNHCGTPHAESPMGIC